MKLSNKHCSSYSILHILIIYFLKISSTESSISPNSNILNTPSPECQEAASHFGLATSDFTLCSVKNARPINLCLGCVQEYLKVLRTYDDIAATKDSANISCKIYYTNLDRFEILASNFYFAKTMWSKGFCNNCFVKNENGTITDCIQPDVSEFRRLCQYYEKCLSIFGWTNTTCTSCSMSYNEINVLYTEVEEKFGEDVCFDIVDTMNRTRENWSHIYKCLPVRKNEFWLYFLMAVVTASPVAFYILAYVLSNVQEAPIVRLRRLRDAVDAVSNGNGSVSVALNRVPEEASSTS